VIPKIIIRLDAGDYYGFGHLSRCLSLSNELISDFSVILIVKTDDKIKVQKFIECNSNPHDFKQTRFLRKDMNINDEISEIVDQVSTTNSFLILDHYSIDESYQLSLNRQNIKWLQFDSHAKQKFYGNLVLHASPGSSYKMYKALISDSNNNTKLLLGTKYSIINRKFLNKRHEVTPRSNLKRVFICFGGGKDKGTTFKCLNMLKNEYLSLLEIAVLISDKNDDIEDIKRIASLNKNITLHINSTEVQNFMADCDLAIIAPGTLSYEAASLGLPMLLITIATNQLINAKGWSLSGCAIDLGSSDDSVKNILNDNIELLIKNPSILSSMSKKCMKSIDGLGAIRVKNEIIKLL